MPAHGKKAWWKRPVRMMRRDYIGDFKAFAQSDLEALAREAKERWHINVEWVMATPGCAPGLAHQTLFNSSKFEKFPALGDFDMLRSYLPHARRHGIHVLAYVNMHWYSYEFAATKPGWEQVTENGVAYGRQRPLYGNGTTLCVNSPWRDWAFEMIREVMRTGVDGCFLDGPVVYPGACYCGSCKSLFAEQNNGAALPSCMDWADPMWPRFARFRSQSWIRFMGGAQAAAREVNPDAVMFLNGSGFSPGGLATARDVSGMEKVQDFTGAEEFFHCHAEYDSPFATLNLARFLSAGEKPAVVFTHHALSTWHYNPLPRAEMVMAMAATAAGGANPWFAIFMDSLRSLAPESFAPMEEMGAFLEKNEEYYTDTESAAETGVLLSNQASYGYVTQFREWTQKAGGGQEKNLIADTERGAVREDLAARREAAAGLLGHEYTGCLDALTFGHVPFQALWDDHLSAARLSKLRCLVLPSAACLSDDQIEAVTAFVEKGGALLATMEAGFYDEAGRPVLREDWLRFLGVARVDGAFAPSRIEDYWTVTGDLPGLRKGMMLPRPLRALRVEAAEDAEELVRINEPVGAAYAPLKGLSRWPGALLSRRGKGRVFYVAAGLFESFDLFHIDAHKDLAKAFLAAGAGRRGLQVECDGPGSLAVETRRQKGRLLIHLLNTTADMKRPMGEIVPLRDVDISVRASGFHRARGLVSGKELKLAQGDGRVAFRAPRIGAYEVVVLER